MRFALYALDSADLDSADLDSADLDSADLDSADLDSADLDSAELNSAELDDAELDDATRADALFASALQRSDEPTAGQIEQAIAAAVREFGDRGCVARVAQEFGEHPENAIARMRWARSVSNQSLAALAS